MPNSSSLTLGDQALAGVAEGGSHAAQCLQVFSKTFDLLDEAVLITDARQRIVRVNQAFTRWTGYAAQELLGQALAVLRADPHDAGFHQKLEKTLAAKGTWRGEVQSRRKNGETYLERLAITALLDPQGQVTHYVSVFTDASSHKQQEAQLRRMAMYDELTKLPNRRLLQSHLDQAMARSKRRHRMLAVCMIDLDGFKAVNDSHGHAAGDLVLETLGRRLPEVLRKSDLVARLGGDEFVLLIEDLSGLQELIPIIQKVDAAISEPFALREGTSVRVGTSMGVYLYPSGAEEAGDQLLRCADQALYESKSHKADRDRFWAVFGEKIQTAAKANAQRLLDGGALELRYQPVLANKSDQIVGLEVLACLRQDDGALLYPQQFLQDLDAGDLRKLNALLLATALRDLALLDEAVSGAPLWVSLALDPKSFDAGLIAGLQGVLASSRVDAQRITLALTRSKDYLERDSALSVLRAIKGLGLRLAVDYAGSAYVSPLLLDEFPIDAIKLDRGFAENLEDHPHGLHFIRVMQDLAMELKVDLVVGGVQTPDVLDAMMTTGVPFLQGDAVSAALDFGALKLFLALPRVKHTVLPQSLFGYYAGTMASHSSIKKMFMINPSELDISTLGDSRLCRGHLVQARLGHGEGTQMAQLHADYHCALGIAAQHFTTNFKNPFWDAVEVRLELLLQHMLLQ